jgi:hypothetical protein
MSRNKFNYITCHAIIFTKVSLSLALHHGEKPDTRQTTEMSEARCRITEEQSDKIKRLTILTAALRQHFKENQSMDALNSAVEAMREITVLLPNDCLDRAEQLNTLGNALYTRYEEAGELEDLNEAINVYTEALETADRSVACSQRNEETLSVCLANLGDDRQERYALQGHPVGLNGAVIADEQS